MEQARGDIPGSFSIMGAGRSGIAAARYLRSRNFTVFISDTCPAEKLDFLLAANDLAHIPHEAQEHSDRLLENEAIIISPGIPSDLPVLKRARKAGIPVWSELELAFRTCKGTFLAITGSSGKSTTTSLLGGIMAASGAPCVVAGNIGIPAVSALGELDDSGYAVVEVSSFQLENIDRFRPSAAAVLNIMKNHLDRYKSLDEYFTAKKQIARNMRVQDHLILNAGDPALKAWAAQVGEATPIVWFGEEQTGNASVWYRDGAIHANFGAAPGRLLNIEDLKIRGPHNYLNACAAAAIALTQGIDTGAIAAGMCSFEGLAHRLEFVAQINGVSYYNDSKSTTAESVLCAVTAFGGNVHLIAGGRDKGCDFSVVRNALRERVKNIFLIGEAAKRMMSEWKGLTSIHREDSLAAAVAHADSCAQPGDVVVLSPGCSSFDMFRDYEHRGESFRDIVRNLAADKEAR